MFSLPQLISKISCELLVDTHTVEVELNGKKDIFGSQYKYTVNPALGKNEINIKFDDIEIKYGDLYSSLKMIGLFNRVHSFTNGVSESIKKLRSKKVDAETLKYKSVETLMEEGNYNILVLNTDNVDRIKELSEHGKLPENLLIFLNTSKSVAMDSGMNFPGMFVYNKSDKASFQMPFPKNTSEAIGCAQLSVLDIYNEATQEYYSGYEGGFYLMIVDEEGPLDKIRMKYLPSFLEYRVNSKIALFKASQVDHIVKMFRLNSSDFPVLGRIDNGKKYIVKNADKDIKGAMTAHLEDKAERVVISQPLPKDNDSRNVKVVNYENINKKIEDVSENYKIFLFTTESCGYCQQIKPVYNKLGELAAKNNWNLEIFNYDANLNDQPKDLDLDLSGVPQIFVVEKNSTKLELIKNGRTLNDILTHFEGKIDGLVASKWIEAEDDESKEKNGAPKVSIEDLIEKMNKDGFTPTTEKEDKVENEVL